MNIHDVVAYFGGSKIAVARALGVTKAAVSDWGGEIPPLRQLQIEELTKGQLKADRSIIYAPRKAA
jgi:DNA-binding transcriptional regulator YdaS (Cro superfamily)